VRGLGLRLLRITLVALAAAALFQILSPHGLGWLVIPAAIVASVVWTAFRWKRVRRGAREERWAAAVLDDSARPGAIRALERELGAGEPTDPRERSRRVRLRVLLAELLDAEGRNDEARELLDAVDPETMTALDAAVVRHGRAVVRLRAGDYEGARDSVGDAPRTGARELDLRIELIAASSALELGDAKGALEAATRVRRRARGDPALTVEARVVRAAALDASGDRDEALKVVRSLGPEMIAMLQKLGQPRVRALAEEAGP